MKVINGDGYMLMAWFGSMVNRFSAEELKKNGREIGEQLLGELIELNGIEILDAIDVTLGE